MFCLKIFETDVVSDFYNLALGYNRQAFVKIYFICLSTMFYQLFVTNFTYQFML